MQDIRNIAIIAHVDHGKTTLVDKMLLAGKLFRDDKAAEVDTYLDNNDLERERGITILSKNVSIRYKDVKINIIDTPGHADFGGEVERVLNLADGCLLLVDAFEGPMPQTRFVLQKAIEMGLKPIVVINKVDKPNCRPAEVEDMVFDLMFSLGATEEQLDFTTIYGSAKQGWMSTDYQQPTEDISILLDTIIREIPAPVQLEGPAQMLITSLDYSSYVGRIAVGRVHRGTLREGQEVALCKRDGTVSKMRIKEVNIFEGLGRTKVESVSSGDICALIGIEGFEIGADDYLVKPFEFPELVARLRALERRNQPAREPVLESRGVRLDPFRREVSRDGHFVRLSPKVFAVLQLLMEADGGVLSAETLLEKAWDANADPFSNTTRVTISHLRKRLGEPWVIQTVPGVGYRFGD